MPLDLQVKGEVKYEVEETLDSKLMWEKLVYLVKWAGNSQDEITWEPKNHFAHLDEYLADFHQKHPEELGLPTKVVRKKKAVKQAQKAPMPRPAETQTWSRRILCYCVSPS